MFGPDAALVMARYNAWQNDSLTRAATGLGQAARREDRGAFWGSIERTFAHLLWADRAWLARFTGGALPAGSLRESAHDLDWDVFLVERKAQDRAILDWAKAVPEDWFEGDLTWYSGALGREMSKPRALCVMQMFNHQTHHRGQIHAMLTAAGARPADTDLPFMPEDWAGL